MRIFVRMEKKRKHNVTLLPRTSAVLKANVDPALSPAIDTVVGWLYPDKSRRGLYDQICDHIRRSKVKDEYKQAFYVMLRDAFKELALTAQ